ncbi:MAG: hypothetical protein O7B26_09590 [Planctomycetota bacterium]|nr:hypothetical protein [Planctomycetota bacterium]
MSQTKASPDVSQGTARLQNTERSLFDCAAGEVSFVTSRTDSEPEDAAECPPQETLMNSDTVDHPILQKPDREVLQDDEDATGPLSFSDEADALDLRIDDLVNEMEGIPLPTSSQPTHPDGIGAIDDHSAAEDVVIEQASAEAIELKPSKIESRLGESCDRSGLASERLGSRSTPQRIGSGRLVPARLTWKPGDPFASDSSSKPIRFRWEVMLTTACCTAVCGMGAIWLLRMVVS